MIFFSRLSFLFFSNGHIHNIVSTLPNVVKINVENDNVVSTLCNIVQINVEIDNVDTILFNVANFIVNVRKVVSTLIWHCATSWCHINLKRLLKIHWNYFKMFAGLCGLRHWKWNVRVEELACVGRDRGKKTPVWISWPVWIPTEARKRFFSWLSLCGLCQWKENVLDAAKIHVCMYG